MILGEGEGVLEFAEAMDGRALELHLVVGSDGSGVVAWWENEAGAWLRAADVGSC